MILKCVLCLFRVKLLVKDFSHFSQDNVFWTVCVFMWFFRTANLLKHFSHSVHWKDSDVVFFSEEHCMTCCLNEYLFIYIFLQCWHSNMVSCESSCYLRLLAWEKDWSHSLQSLLLAWYSNLWVNSCFLVLKMFSGPSDQIAGHYLHWNYCSPWVL